MPLLLIVASTALALVLARACQDGQTAGDTGFSEQMREAEGAAPYEGEYRSPYRLTFHVPREELLFDVESRELRSRIEHESSVPERDWYSEESRSRWGAWGVPPRRFECPPRVHEKPAAWKRERVVAAAARFIGYEYQHHHVPDWDPPRDWPWIKCCAGHNGKGVDCSNFSGWNYNWALGIHLNTDITVQAERMEAEYTTYDGRGSVRAQVIARPEGNPDEWYDRLCKELLPGDLLYIKGTEDGKVTHVIMWVGDCGVSPDGTPLVIDSTGGEVKDSNGHKIPCGIHLRPFRKGSWYHRCFGHAHRWVRERE